MSEHIKLLTPLSDNLSEMPWNVYPRPQLKRNSFFCLNGKWDFCVNDGEVPQTFSREILVPFAPESVLSGVDEVFDESKTLWYKRIFLLPKGFLNERVILHFGAVDQTAVAFLNGQKIGEHTGGYEPFCFDITDYLKDENEIVVSVTDNLSNFILPYGKQCKKRGGMWYTSVSGIWQTVWIESVPNEYIKSLKIDVGLDYADITVNGVESGIITVQNIDYSFTDGKMHIDIENPHLWSPEDPYLYKFEVKTEKDSVESYFALRTLQTKEIDGIPRLCLNDKPYFFHGLLDQGYFSDGIFTPASPECYEDDILKMKSLGFNMLRKHIKSEPEQFYYDCDRLGMIVFQDMVNNGDYSFFRDTILPTIGFVKKNDKYIHKDKTTREQFENHMIETVTRLYNHPSICYWTVFNEGWGQFCGTEMYRKLKSIDNSRFVDTTSGWFISSESDVTSRHIYFKKLKSFKSDKPYVLSEFGGYSFKVKEHSFNQDKTYGYGKFKKREEFVSALCKLYKNEVIPLVKQGLCASVYTQVSDVEDETNGLLTYDRCILKIKPEEFEEISSELKESI